MVALGVDVCDSFVIISEDYHVNICVFLVWIFFSSVVLV